jgi:hypothetical protein
MFAIPFSFILIPYAVVLLFVALMSFISVSHLVRHGATSGISFIVTFLFIVGSASILFGTWTALQGTDWTQQITLSLPTMSLGTSGLAF